MVLTGSFCLILKVGTNKKLQSAGLKPHKKSRCSVACLGGNSVARCSIGTCSWCQGTVVTLFRHGTHLEMRECMCVSLQHENKTLQKIKRTGLCWFMVLEVPVHAQWALFGQTSTKVACYGGSAWWSKMLMSQLRSKDRKEGVRVRLSPARPCTQWPKGLPLIPTTCRGRCLATRSLAFGEPNYWQGVREDLIWRKKGFRRKFLDFFLFFFCSECGNRKQSPKALSAELLHQRHCRLWVTRTLQLSSEDFSVPCSNKHTTTTKT